MEKLSKEALAIGEGIDQIKIELPQLAQIFDAFRDLLTEIEDIKSDLPRFSVESDLLDPLLRRQGRPLLTKEDFKVSAQALKPASIRLIPLMKKGFPALEEELDVLGRAISEQPDEAYFLPTAGPQDYAESDLFQNVPGPVLVFSNSILLRPFNRKVGESIDKDQSKEWHRGYCPICGSWPELSFIEEPEGARFLKCSFCGHEWRFSRLQCPFCENEVQDQLEFLYSEDRKNERAELCIACKKYILGIDMRDLIKKPLKEIASLGMIYLDILAQDKGFVPGAVLLWNNPK